VTPARRARWAAAMTVAIAGVVAIANPARADEKADAQQLLN
jgi:hypothetical protein